MTFRTSRSLVALAVAFNGSAALAADASKTLDGKAVFQAQKCDACHAVSSAAIKPTGKIKAPDLAGVEKRDPGLLAKYLRKEESVNGKKHLKPFTGSDEELHALIAWLQTQNAK